MYLFWVATIILNIPANEPNQVPITWYYLRLQAIVVTPGVCKPQANLHCLEEEGGWITRVRCDDSFLEYLKPYAELLEAAEAGLDTEFPVVPVEFHHGRAMFSTRGAEMDYPELRDRRRSRLPALPGAMTPPPEF